MASLDSLPADQRAVLQLVLQRGRTYDDIAGMLSINRAGVRERALAAFDALGPQTGVPPERRALITDYLLGQLPPKVSESTRARLAESPAERAWARVIASELGQISSKPLPEIPVESAVAAPPEPDIAHEPPAAATPKRKRERQPLFLGRRRSGAPPPPGAPEPTAASTPRPPAGGDPQRPASRRGGALLLIAGGLVVLIVVIIIIVSGGSSKNHSSTTSSSTAASVSSSASASTTASTTASATPIASITLAPTSAGSKAKGVAIIVRQGTATGIVIQATGVVPNTKHNAYAVWLYNSPTDAHILGFVNPGVGANGRLTTAGGLPANASGFKQILVTLETQANPHAPGTIILEGTLKGV